MAYIGRGLDKISNIEKLDVITFDGSQSYTLQKGGSNFTPSSANNLFVSIDGVVQAGNFTVSGSTIDFGTAVAGTSTNDFIFHFGTGLITTPADGSVTTAKLADSSVSLAKLTATGTKDSTTFLRGDNTFAEAGGGKVLQVVQTVITTGQSTTSTSYVTSNLNASITPSSVSSKVYVILSGGNAYHGSNGDYMHMAFHRDATIIANYPHGVIQNTSGTNYFKSSWSASYLDSPASTSSLTYTPYYLSSSGTATFNEVNSSVQLTLMEIAG